MNSYSVCKLKKQTQKAVETSFVVFVIFTLTIYPAALPFYLVKADDGIVDQTSTPPSTSDNSSSSDSNNSSTPSKDSPTADSSGKVDNSSTKQDASSSSSQSKTDSPSSDISKNSSDSSSSAKADPAPDTSNDQSPSDSNSTNKDPSPSDNATPPTDVAPENTANTNDQISTANQPSQSSDEQSSNPSPDINNNNQVETPVSSITPASVASTANVAAQPNSDTTALVSNTSPDSTNDPGQTHKNNSDSSSTNNQDQTAKKTDSAEKAATTPNVADQDNSPVQAEIDATAQPTQTENPTTTPNNALVESANSTPLLVNNFPLDGIEPAAVAVQPATNSSSPVNDPSATDLTSKDEVAQKPNETIKNNNNVDATSNTIATADTGNSSVGIPNSPTSPTQPEAEVPIPVPTDNSITSPNNGLVSSATSIPLPVPDPSIQTADASSDSTIVNVANTNVVSDNYVETVTNITGNNSDDINLLEQFQALLQKGVSVDDATKTLNITNDNVAKLENEAVALANTGTNTINTIPDTTPAASPTTPAPASIATGDASAAANIVNVVNQNLVGNSWLFAIINVLGVWSGNLILPGQDLLTTPATDSSTTYNVTDNNQATVDNSATSVATTGNNSTITNGSATAVTGDANSSSNVQTVANTNITKNNWFFLMINNMGNWTGEVLGWDSATGSDQTLYSYDFGSSPDGFVDPNTETVNVTNNNNASISNTADAEANTGNNSISNTVSGLSSTITTGAANAKANIFNLINTNIVGNNWMFAIVNIMGSWKGNAVFAYPDLAISINTDNDSIPSDSNSTFNITYQNEGQAPSDDANINVELPAGIMNFSDGSSNFSQKLDGLKPGEQKTIQLTAQAAQIDQEEISTNISASISTETPEKNLSNNTAEQSITITNSSADDSSNDNNNISSKLRIERKSLAPQITSNGEILTHTITVKNESDGPLYGIVVKDSIVDPIGNSIAKYQWPIGELKQGKDALIQYQIMIADTAKIGTYTNTAKGFGYNELDKKISSNSATIATNITAQFAQNNSNSADGNDQPTIVASPYSGQPPIGQVLGAENIIPKNYKLFWPLLIFLFTYSLGYGVNESIKKQGSWQKIFLGKI